MKNNQLANDDLDPLPLIKILLKNKIFSSRYLNGYSKHIDKILVKVYSRIEECYELWVRFSPKESLFDLWEFRFSWYQSYNYRPYFYSLIYKNNVLGFIPLWYDSQKKRFEWYGSDWMEDNKFFVDDERFIPLLISILPKPYYLNAILPQYNALNLFNLDEEKYIQSLDNIKNIDQFLSSLNKKHRYHLKHDYYSVLSLNPKVIFVNEPKHKDLLEFKYFTEEVFNGENREVHDIILKERFRAYQNILKIKDVLKTQIIKVYIQNKLAGIDMIVLYKKKYYPLKAAYDTRRFNGIGNFMNYIELKNAIERGYQLIDCLQGNYNWKSTYYKPLPLLKIEAK